MVELIWDGKYDKQTGQRTAPPRLKLPFQTVETVNESAQQRQLALDLFSAGRPTEWRNRLIWGDKKYVLPALLAEGFAGQVGLIYIDPPFNVGADFSFTATIPDDPEIEEPITETTFMKEPSMIEVKAYRDTWGRGLDSYLQWFYETVVLLRELLTEEGSIYVHLDYHVGHYAKVILDEIFGERCFVNEIIWRRTAAHNDPGRYGNIHDVIFFYTRAEKYTWNPQFIPHSEEAIASSFSYAEAPNGTTIRLKKGESVPIGYRRFQTVTLRSPHPRPNLWYEYKGYKPHPNGWSCNKERMEQYDREGRLFFPTSMDGAIRLKMYLDESPGIPVQDLWTEIKKLEASSVERLNYTTQKPEAILERIIRVSSNEGDLVLDCFCGSGTTAATAEKLNRRWITCDLGRFAIHTTRKRLLSIENVKPFEVQNLGKYERQAWQTAEFSPPSSGKEEGQQAASLRQAQAAGVINQYRRFILELYRARPIEGYSWLHGLKSGRMVHVGPVDAPISPGDVKQIAMEFRKAVGTGKDAPKESAVDVLGWDFAFELNEVAKQQAAEANLIMRFIRIPREVLEKKAVEQGDIKFFELAALSVEREVQGRAVNLKLTDFVIPPDDVPAEVQAAISHWSQWIDYWAVDWDNQGDAFHNMWQSYRTRQSKSLGLQAGHKYDSPGEYVIGVKVIDILGNDTTKTLKVKVT